jgi:hypothetical protein
VPGTLLAYDEAFPRAIASTGPIRNTPSVDELRANGYPEPFRLLPVTAAAQPQLYCRSICDAARALGELDRLIIFGHGQVVNAATARGSTRVTTGIVMGASPLTADNARMLGTPPIRFAGNAQAELWVCEAAAAGEAGGRSGVLLCQAIADALGVTVVAADVPQEYTSQNQSEIPSGGWQSTAVFLPWEGGLIRFTPRVRRRGPSRRR